MGRVPRGGVAEPSSRFRGGVELLTQPNRSQSPMTKTMMDLHEVIEKRADAAISRETIGFTAERLMEPGGRRCDRRRPPPE